MSGECPTVAGERRTYVRRVRGTVSSALIGWKGGRRVMSLRPTQFRSGSEVDVPPVVERLLLDVVQDGFALYCCGGRAEPSRPPWWLPASGSTMSTSSSSGAWTG